jgi:hypothetical protein
MTFLEAQRAARRGGHRLVDASRTPNGLFRMLVCERCGGKILARSPDEAGGDIAVWSCTPREARENDRYWWMPYVAARTSGSCPLTRGGGVEPRHSGLL